MRADEPFRILCLNVHLGSETSRFAWVQAPPAGYAPRWMNFEHTGNVKAGSILVARTIRPTHNQELRFNFECSHH